MKPTALLLAICCSLLSTPSPMRFSSVLPARRLRKKTLRKVQPLPRFSAMNCTAIPLQTAFAMKTCWAFTPSISAPLKTAIYADLSLCKKPKQKMKAKYLPMIKRKKSTINLWTMYRWQATMLQTANIKKALRIMYPMYNIKHRNMWMQWSTICWKIGNASAKVKNIMPFLPPVPFPKPSIIIA